MVPEVGSPRIRELIFGTYRIVYKDTEARPCLLSFTPMFTAAG
ncbi:hypothetical protein [Acidithiobacillus albertensis]